MPIQFTPLQGTQQSAEERRTVYALSTIHLFQSSLNPNGSTPKADYVAAEANYDTYVAQTFTAWLPAILAPGSGYMIESPLVQFAVGPVDPVTPNVIGGCYVLDAAGVIRIAVKFDTAVPMQVAGQGIPISIVELFPTNF